MTRDSAIWDRAKSALTLSRPDGRADLFLWEQAVRIARSALTICDVAVSGESEPDRAAIVAAALFHNAAWVGYVRREVVAPEKVLLLPLKEDHYALSAQIMESTLHGELEVESFARALEAVQSLGHRSAECVEAHVVSDAVQLEEFSLSSLWPTIRRGVFEAQSIRSVIERWRRRSEYHFWSARLEESFHFDEVRKLASARLERLGRVIADLEREQQCDDAMTNDPMKRPG